ncbi:hypothetical protein PFLmoz3_00863 [Pseudomonas fluorescens]|uniref:Uncharacterized protein n=1 Tax=Pseudomonas fluorescens TaxID=294 RepID=A0A120G8V2_PSEFL|nr:hypothetical protein PFLmoz3_00863 [Pseudomonas fluorescens]
MADETGDVRRLRFVIEVVGRVPLLKAAFLEDPDVIADGEGLFLIMGYQDRAGAASLEDVAHFMAELAAQFAIEVGKGFIQQQQLRLRRQDPGESDALLLTTGKLMGEALAQVLQVDQFQQLGNYALFLRVLANAKGDVVSHAQVREQRVVLEHHADTTFFRGEGETGTGDDFARQADFAFMHRFKASNRAQGSGLATP